MTKPRSRGRRETLPASVPPLVVKTPFVPDWRKHIPLVAAVCAFSLLAYSNSFRAGLVVDSASRIVQDPRVHAATAENVALIFQSDYWHPALGTGLYRPLTTLSFLFNYAVLGSGANPFGYHLTNWLLHALNISLVYLLAWRLMREIAPAFAIAALWSVHPVLTESVTNIVGRADLLAATGVLGGLLCYIESTKAAGSHRWAWLGGAALAVAVGVFSKEGTVVVLAVVALYELARGAAKRGARLAGYAALMLPCAAYWLMRQRTFAHAPPMHVPFTDNPMAGADFFTARWTAVKVIGKQVLLLLWPARLSSDYSYNQIPLASWSDWRAWAALAVCLAAAVAAVIAYRRNKALFFWIGFFFLTLAPTSNLAVVIGSPMAERFLYLPAIGFLGCAVMAMRAAASRIPSRAFYAAVAAAAIALAARTYARNPDWRDEATLWTSAAAASPASYKTHLLVANIAARKLDDALAELDAAIAIVNNVPDRINTPTPFLNAGRRYREKGDTQPAPQSLEWYRKSLDLLLRAERIQDAHNQRNRQQQERLGRPFIEPWTATGLELGRTYDRLGEFAKAVDAVRASLKLRFSIEDLEQLSVLYFRMGNSPQAAIALLEGLVVQPQNTRLASELVSLYGQTAPASCAVQNANGAQSLNLECPMVHQHLCTAAANVTRMHREGGRVALARQTARTATDRLQCAPGPFDE